MVMEKAGRGPSFRIAMVAILLISSAFVSIYSETVNDAVVSAIGDTNDSDDYDLVGLFHGRELANTACQFPREGFPELIIGTDIRR